MKILLGILLFMFIVVIVLCIGILIVISALISYEVIRDKIYDIRDTSEKRKIRRNEEKE